MASECVAAQEGRQAELPGKKQQRARASREVTLLIAKVGSNGSTAILVERRPPSGVWGGLWSPPQFNTDTEALAWCSGEFRGASNPETLPPIEHAFTHFDLRLKPLVIHCEPGAKIGESDDRLWYQLDSPPRIGLPQPISQLFQRLRTALRA
jgi:A/G-specific adenine glycosylase